MKILTLAITLLCLSCSSDGGNTTQIVGGRKYTIINKLTARNYMDKADAVIAWHQSTDTAVIRTKHRGDIKEGTFFIPNLATGLSKLHKGKKTIIMILDEELLHAKGTTSILNSLNPRWVRVYITFFKEKLLEEQ